MNITINTKNQVHQTIGRTDDFKPVLLFKIGQLKQARVDLANYFNTFNEVIDTGIEFDEVEYAKFSDQFYQQAVQKANDFINGVIENAFKNGTMYNNRFIGFLPIRRKGKWTFKY